MAYLYNVTFIMANDQESDFLKWMRDEAIPALFNSQSPARNPRLQKVVETGGEKPTPEHGTSIALQAEFVSAVLAHSWNDTMLPAVLVNYTEKFGPHAIFFVTMLETLTT